MRALLRIVRARSSIVAAGGLSALVALALLVSWEAERAPPPRQAATPPTSR
jgi:hypothetical protein